jgi:nucleoside-diphosphate-sugar epimerase
MQFANSYGPDNKTGNLISYTIDTLSAGLAAQFGSADQPYDFIYIDDLVEAAFRLGESKLSKTSYYIGSGAPLLLKDYLFEIGRIMGKSEMVEIGVRTDDGVRYTCDMFDITSTVKDIGVYVSHRFDEGIRLVLDEKRNNKS